MTDFYAWVKPFEPGFPIKDKTKILKYAMQNNISTINVRFFVILQYLRIQ